jgi:ribosome-binding factor A
MFSTMLEGGGHRHTRLQQLMEEEIGALLRDEVVDPRLDGASCSGVELSVDYRSARVRFMLPAERQQPADIQKAERAFEKATAFFRARLGEALDLKRVPELRFVYDRTVFTRT